MKELEKKNCLNSYKKVTKLCQYKVKRIFLNVRFVNTEILHNNNLDIHSTYCKGCPFRTLALPRGEGSALFSDLSTSYVLDMGREGSKCGEILSTSYMDGP